MTTGDQHAPARRGRLAGLFFMALAAHATPSCAAPSAAAPPGGGPSTELTPPIGGPTSAWGRDQTDPDAELEERTRMAVLAHRPRLRACYEDALAKQPTMEGRIVLVVDIGQDGRALRVLEARREGLSDDVVRCLARVLRTVAFHDGAARPVRIQVPLSFSSKDR